MQRQHASRDIACYHQQDTQKAQRDLLPDRQGFDIDQPEGTTKRLKNSGNHGVYQLAFFRYSISSSVLTRPSA